MLKHENDEMKSTSLVWASVIALRKDSIWKGLAMKNCDEKFRPAERLKFSTDKVKVNGWTADQKHSNEMTVIKINA